MLTDSKPQATRPQHLIKDTTFTYNRIGPSIYPFEGHQSRILHDSRIQNGFGCHNRKLDRQATQPYTHLITALCEGITIFHDINGSEEEFLSLYIPHP